MENFSSIISFASFPILFSLSFWISPETSYFLLPCFQPILGLPTATIKARPWVSIPLHDCSHHQLQPDWRRQSPDCQEYSATQLCSSICVHAESTSTEQCCDTPHTAGTKWSRPWTTGGTFVLRYNLAAGGHRDEALFSSCNLQMAPATLRMTFQKIQLATSLEPLSFACWKQRCICLLSKHDKTH